MGKHNHTAVFRKDVFAIILITIIVFLFSVQFNLFENLITIVAPYRLYHLEEIIFTIMILSFFISALFYRRWRSLKNLAVKRGDFDAAGSNGEQQDESMLTSIPNLTFRLRRDGIYLDFRSEYPDDVLGDSKLVIGKNIRDQLPKDVSDLVMHHLDLALSTNEIQTYNYTLEINGKQRSFHARMITSGADEVFVLVRHIENTNVVSLALAQSETRFREVVESLNEGLIITDLDENVVYMNQRMIDLCGWTFDEMKGKSAYAFLLPKEQWPVIAERNKKRRNGMAERYELEMLRKDGMKFWANVYGAPLRDADKKIIGTIGTITDITERIWNERLQSALYRIANVTREAQDMQHLFASLHTIIGELIYAKNFYIALYDPVKNNLSFPYFVDTVNSPPEVRSFSYSSTEYILKTGHILHAPAPASDTTSSLDAVTPIGPRAVDWLGVPLSSGGKTFGVMTIQSYNPKVVFTDREKEILVFVSQHIAAAIQQKSEEDRFRAVWEHSGDGMRVTDKDGNIVMVNEAYCKLVNKRKDELIGKLFHIIYDEDEIKIQHGLEDYKARFKDGSILSRSEAQIVLWDGRVLNVEATASFITFGINERMLLSIFRDITERKRLEDQLLHAQKIDSIGVLAGGIAHDFNNVLAMIMGSAEIVKYKAKNHPDILKFAQMIAGAAERGSGIAKQLLTFARAEKGVMKPLSLSAVTLDVCKLLEHSIPKTVSIRTEFITENDVIMGDEDQLHQLIINLGVNARDAIEQTKKNGALTFRIANIERSALNHLLPAADSELFVSLTVSDTGCGMDEATVQRIYDPFFSTKERGKGTGLGLAIVHGIVKTHSGVIDVHSTVGKGTSFTLYFPATLIGDELHLPLPPKKTPTVHPNNIGSKKVLIVDDEKEFCELLKEILETEGYQTLSAHDGQQALDIYNLEKDNIGVIISDLGMPNMDGRELIRELTLRKAKAKFVFITGYVDKDTKKELFSLGARDVLLKPFSSEDVLTTLSKVESSFHVR